MSVLPCARDGCGGIMCDRYSPTYGYICYECFDQLCRLPIGTDVAIFMEGADLGPPDLEDFYDEEFPIT